MAKKQIVGLTPEDRKLVQEIIDRVQAMPENGPGITKREIIRLILQYLPTPDVYICLPDEGGIPGLTMAESTPGEGDEPGSALCTVYNIYDDVLMEHGRQRLVYNLLEEPFTEQWLVAIKTKQGMYVAVLGTLGEMGTGTGTGTGTSCEGIPGVDFDDLSLETEPEYVLGIKDGCLVKVPVSICEE